MRREALDDRLRAPAAPHDRVGQRLAGRRIPRHHRLALVVETDRVDPLGPPTAATTSATVSVDRADHVARVLRDPARLRMRDGDAPVRLGDRLEAARRRRPCGCRSCPGRRRSGSCRYRCRRFRAPSNARRATSLTSPAPMRTSLCQAPSSPWMTSSRAVAADGRDAERQVADGRSHPHAPAIISSASRAARRPASSAAAIEPRSSQRLRVDGADAVEHRAVDVAQRHERRRPARRRRRATAVVADAARRRALGAADLRSRARSRAPARRRRGAARAPPAAPSRRRRRWPAGGRRRRPSRPGGRRPWPSTTPWMRSPSMRSSARLRGRAPDAITRQPARMRRTPSWPIVTSSAPSQVMAVSPRCSVAPAARAADSSRRVSAWSKPRMPPQTGMRSTTTADRPSAAAHARPVIAGADDGDGHGHTSSGRRPP